MSEWVEKPLGQLAKFQKGRKVATSDHRQAGYAAYLGASSIGNGGGVEGYASTQFAVMAEPGDVLMLWDGERSGLVGHGMRGVVSSTVQRLVHSKEISGTYLYYHLLSRFDWIQGRRTGTGVPHVPKDLARILTVKYPVDTIEQERITDVLASLDIVIEKTEALIAKYQQIKAGLMHDLFTRGITADGKLRPPREQAPELYQQTPIGWIPKEWKLKCLDEVRDSRQAITYGVLKPGPFIERGIPLLQIEDVIHGEIDFSKTHRISAQLDSEYSRTRVRGGEIVISLVGTVGRVAQLPALMTPSNLHRNLGLIVVNEEVVPRYFFYFLQTYAFHKLLAQSTLGSTQSLLNLASLRSFLIPLPEYDERVIIANSLESISEQIVGEEVSLNKLRQMKAGLMFDLLTGKVRLNPAAVPA